MAGGAEGAVRFEAREGLWGSLGGSFLMLTGFWTDVKKDDMVLFFFEVFFEVAVLVEAADGLVIGVIAM